MNYHKLTRAEIDQFAQIDRSETVPRYYSVHEGTLELVEEPEVFPDWTPAEKQDWIRGLRAFYDQGATIFGAFDGPLMVGLSALGHHFMQTGYKRLELSEMWVSSGYRGQGIGRTLFQWAVQEAHKLGAHALYISATPSENTIHFYQNLGCRLADPVDPDLFTDEPVDIHLELLLFR